MNYKQETHHLRQLQVRIKTQGLVKHLGAAISAIHSIVVIGDFCIASSHCDSTEMTNNNFQNYQLKTVSYRYGDF